MAEQDVVELLRAQHAQIQDLFRDVLDSDGDRRRERFADLVRLLAVHETAEEEVVHPIGRLTVAAGDEVVDARLAEEYEAKQMLADLYEDGTDDPGFLTGLTALREAVLEHAKREERYEFPYLRQKVDPKTRTRMAKAVIAAQKLAPTRPHPGVESQAANILAGPPLAVVDRVRDAVRDAMRSD